MLSLHVITLCIQYKKITAWMIAAIQAVLPAYYTNTVVFWLLYNLSLSYPWRRASRLGASVFPAKRYAQHCNYKQAHHPCQNSQVTFCKIENKTVCWNQDNRCYGRSHRNLCKYFFVILLSIKFDGQNWCQNHYCWTYQTMQKCG